MKLTQIIKKFVLPLAVIRPLQPVYEILHRLSLIGMNIGPVGDIATSGEVRLIRKLMKIAPPDAIVFDVGANVGEFSIACVQYLPLGGCIFAFEPSPSVHRNLVKNICSANVSDRITTVPMGLADRARQDRLFVTSGFEGNSSVYVRHLDHLTDKAKEESVDLTTLDDFCDKKTIKRVFFIKVDIEGEEFACLRGGNRLLASGNIDYLQFEFGGCDIQSRVFLKDFWDMLSPNYKLYRILQNNLWEMKQYHELSEIFTTTNYLAVRRGLRAPV